MDFKEMELKTLIKNAERRLYDIKKMLEEIHKDKTSFPPQDELVVWFKTHLRDVKNSEQTRLKDLVEERTNENEGLNPPWFYPEYWKNKADWLK